MNPIEAVRRSLIGATLDGPPVPRQRMIDAFDAYHRAVTENAQLQTPPETPLETCTWKEDADGYWHGACGVKWRSRSGRPTGNTEHFCPKCGKNLTFQPPAADDEPLLGVGDVVRLEAGGCPAMIVGIFRSHGVDYAALDGDNNYDMKLLSRAAPREKLSPGDLIEFVGGPYKDQSGRCVGCGRARVYSEDGTYWTDMIGLEEPESCSTWRRVYMAPRKRRLP